MKIIWKYVFDSPDVIRTFSIPENAQLLHIREQHGFPCIWALVETNNEKEERTFELARTGTKMHSDITKAVYIGTAFMQGGTFVFHIFEIK